MLLPMLLVAVQLTSAGAVYDCLCSNTTSAKVYLQPFEFSTLLGNLTTGECKPTIIAGTSIRWRAIQFHRMVGFVLRGPLIQEKACAGYPQNRDTVPLPSSTTWPSIHLMSPSSPKVTRILSTVTTVRSTAATTANSSSKVYTDILPKQCTNAHSARILVYNGCYSIFCGYVPLPSSTTGTYTYMTSTSSLKVTRVLSFKSTVRSTAATTASNSSVYPGTTTITRALQCPPRVPRSMYLKEFGQHCYEFIFGRAVKWPEAENDCKRKGGHLVSISSPAEQSFVYNNLKSLHFHGDAGVWIGFTDKQREGTWTWSSGERVTYTHWLKGQPGGFMTASFEDCAVMEADLHGQWADYSCEGILFTMEKHGWVCEYLKQ